MSLQSKFVQVARKYEDRTAVCYDDGVEVVNLTYKQTHVLSCQVANVLRKFGVQNTIVGYFGTVTAVVPSIFVGILESVAAFAVIDRTSSASYNQNFIEKLGMKCVIVEPSFYQRHLERLGNCKLEKLEVFLLDIHEFYLLKLSHPEWKCHTLPEGQQLAYAIQTSGTTGYAKIVRVPHSCVCPNVNDFCHLFSVSSEDTLVLTAPLTFDPSIIEIFTALSCGATLLMMPDLLKAIPNKFAEIVSERNKATIIQATPSLFRRIGQETLKKTLLSRSSSLRVLAFGGEACPTVSILNSWKETKNRTEFYNVYGITEVSSWAAIHRIDVISNSEASDSIPLGQALSSTIIEVLDDNSQLVSQGEGQLYVGGTERICLIDDEDPNSLNCKIMRPTGDWVLLTPNGTIIYLGRQDDTIKRNGKKLILSSVEENATSLLPGASCCCVYEKNVEKLWLFVSPVSNVNLKKRESIMEKLQSLLPSHCIPDEILVVPFFPVTSHGKVDKVALVDHAKSNHQSSSPIVNLQTIQSAFLSSWKEILHEVSEEDNFVLKGGDSFSAVRFSARMSLLTGQPLPLLTEKLLQQTLVDVWEYIVSCTFVDSQDKEHVKNSRIAIGDNREEICETGNATMSKRSADNAVGIKVYKKKRSSSGHQCVRQAEVTIVQRARLLMHLNCDNCNKIIQCQLRGHLSEHFSVRLQWKYDLKKCVDASPLVVVQCSKNNSFVYVGSHSHRMAAIELESGKESWVMNLNGRIESSAAATWNGQCIIVGCYDYSIYCLNTSDGGLKWKFPTKGEVKSSPCIAGDVGLVYVGSHDHHLYAINVENGTCKWVIQPSDGSLFASPCYCQSSGYLFVATLDGLLCAVDPETGIIFWKVNCGQPIFSSPAASSTGVCFGCVNSFLYCYSNEGQKKWKFASNGPIFSSPCIVKCQEEVVVLFGSHDHFAYCLQFDNGILLWKADMGAPIYSTPFAFEIGTIKEPEQGDGFADNVNLSFDRTAKNASGEACAQTSAFLCKAVAFVSTIGMLRILNVETGLTMARYQFAGEVFSSPVVVGQHLIVGCRDNFVYCTIIEML